jgi:hypothetical protein
MPLGASEVTTVVSRVPALPQSSSATFQTTSIARLGHAAAAPLHRTFPIVIGENKGCFSVHSENTIREADVHFRYGWINGSRRTAAQSGVTLSP